MAGPADITVRANFIPGSNEFLTLNDADHARFSLLPTTTIVDIFQPPDAHGRLMVMMGDSLYFMYGQGPLYNPPLDGFWAFYTELRNMQHWLITVPHPRTWEALRALVLHAWAQLPVRLQEIRDADAHHAAYTERRLLLDLSDDTDDDEHRRRRQQALQSVSNSDPEDDSV